MDRIADLSEGKEGRKTTGPRFRTRPTKRGRDESEGLTTTLPRTEVHESEVTDVSLPYSPTHTPRVFTPPVTLHPERTDDQVGLGRYSPCLHHSWSGE